MYKKAKIILPIMVVILFITSFALTIKYLELDFNKKDKNMSSSETEIIETDKNLRQVGSFSGNVFQKYDINDEEYGLLCYDDDYYYTTNILKNKYVLNKVNKNNISDTFPILSGYKVKNMISVGDYIFGVVNAVNEEDILMDQIVKISKSGDGKEIYSSTQATFITSMISDGKRIFFTKENDHYIYSINTDGTETQKIVKISINKDNPILFGIFEGKIYFVDGESVSTLDIETKEIETISKSLTSIKQNPIMYKNKIYYLTSLAGKGISCLNIATRESIVVVDENEMYDLTKINSNILNLNYNSGILFYTYNNKIYYIDIETSISINELKDVKSLNNNKYYIIDDNVIIEEVKYGNLTSTPINWILAK